MTNLPFAVAAALLLSASTAIPPETSTQEQVGTESVIDTVEVTAERERVRKAVATFVSSVMRSDGQHVARWRDRRNSICPWASGVSPEQADYIKSRIGEVATAAGVKLNGNAKCTPNLLVFLTTAPNDLMAALKDRRPQLFSGASPRDIDDFLQSTRPVRVWRTAILTNADGSAAGSMTNSAGKEVGVNRLKDSHIAATVAEDIAAVIVVVNTSTTGPATFGQLSDYVAMISLAHIDQGAELGTAPTILQLFAATGQENAPRKLTEWDQAFLKALYENEDPLLNERTAIATRMAQDLVGSSIE